MLKAVVPPGGGEAIPSTNGSFYWPADGIVDGGVLHVFATRARATGTGMFDLAIEGAALATFSLNPGAPPALRDAPVLVGGAHDPMWGAALATDDAFVYVYGTRKTNPG